ncbi:hypothetical protein AB0H71_19640 [Nocardia sp. NPDC050697]|uniref:hypothetical protein n=1 Tax=Nocardia sp. NPDC050697 TaxID=3155158 RepID=UPI0033EB8CF5
MSPVTGRDIAVADDLLLAAEVAEAEADAAEARAEAARARAEAARLRRRAGGERSVSAEGGTNGATRERSGSAGTDGVGVTAADTQATTTVATKPAAAVGDGDVASEDAADESGGAASAKEGADEGRPAEESAGRVRRWRAALAANPRRTALRAAAVLVIAAALATSGFLGFQHREAAARERGEAEFAAAAKQGVIALTTLDFTHAAADVQRVLDNSTGPFRDDFQNRSTDFTSVIEQSQVATEGTVNAVAVESMTDDSAVVLVAATSKVTNSGGAQQEPRAWRLSVTVQREGDSMRMSKVEFVP